MNAIQKTVMTPEQAKQDARRKELEAELSAMGRNPNIRFTVVKFIDKKGVEQTGLNIHGVTAKPLFLYGSQALNLATVTADLQSFVEENRAILSWKK